MALAIALSVIATVGTGIVLTARIIYGMASYRVLPEFLSNVSRRYATPVWSSILVGFLLIAIAAVYLLTSSVQNAFDNVIAVTGLLFSIFYILTALAMIVYYRRRVFSSVWNTIVLAILPLAAAGFLGWVLVKSFIAAPGSQKWSLVGIIALGVVLMLSARFIQKSPFFQVSRESDSGQAPARHA
jgi:amino acid transporter